MDASNWRRVNSRCLLSGLVKLFRLRRPPNIRSRYSCATRTTPNGSSTPLCATADGKFYWCPLAPFDSLRSLIAEKVLAIAGRRQRDLESVDHLKPGRRRCWGSHAWRERAFTRRVLTRAAASAARPVRSSEEGSGTRAPSAGGLLSGVALKLPASLLKSAMFTVPS